MRVKSPFSHSALFAFTVFVLIDFSLVLVWPVIAG
jgi:hypothetical protein